MSRSRAWRVADFIGIADDRASVPRRGSRAWWLRLAFVLALIALGLMIVDVV